MNKVMLIGNVGQEPEVRYYDADQAYARVRLATTERGKTLQNGTQVPDRTDWHNLLFNKNLAKVVERYVHTGDKLYVEGRIRYRSYDDKKGQRRYYTEIDVENMEILSSKPTQPNNSGNMASEPFDQPSSGTGDEGKLPF
ncbi:MAG: single-stranded DNA-binding protein [Prevotella sp.]|nr:single-stranded DNA-binding protein [Prevotella sp.]